MTGFFHQKPQILSGSPVFLIRRTSAHGFFFQFHTPSLILLSPMGREDIPRWCKKIKVAPVYFLCAYLLNICQQIGTPQLFRIRSLGIYSEPQNFINDDPIHTINTYYFPVSSQFPLKDFLGLSRMGKLLIATFHSGKKKWTATGP